MKYHRTKTQIGPWPSMTPCAVYLLLSSQHINSARVLVCTDSLDFARAMRRRLQPSFPLLCCMSGLFHQGEDFLQPERLSLFDLNP